MPPVNDAGIKKYCSCAASHSTLIHFIFQKVAERFLQGDIDVDAFLDQFQTTRKIMHLRRVKADKMSDLLTKKPLSQNPAAAPAPYPPFPSGGVPYYPPAPPVGGAPYPTGPFNMPLPGGYPVPRY